MSAVVAGATERPLGVDVYRRLFDSGLSLAVSPDLALGFIVVDVWHSVGSMADPPGRSGLAHLVEHVLFASAEGDPDSAVVGGHSLSSNATTSFERTNYVDTGAPESLDAMLAAAADRLRRAAEPHTQAEIDHHRAVVCEEIRQREQPSRFGSGLRRSLALRFDPDHPFHRPALGDPAQLADITAAEVDRFVQSHYGLAGTVVSVVGSADPCHAAELVARHFADMPHCPRPKPLEAPPARPGNRRDDVYEDQPSGLLRFTFALPADGDPLSAAGEVTMAALVGTPWSVLGAGLVATGHALAAGGEHVRCATGSSIGLVKINTPGAVDLTSVEDLAVAQLAALPHALTEDVLEAGRAKLIKENLARVSGARGRAEELCRHEAWFGDADSVNDRIGDVLAVTRDDVTKVCEYLSDPSVVAFHSDAEQEASSWIA